MPRTILVAVDGSDHAAKALAQACDMAAKYRARLVIVHALLSDARSDTLRRLANRRALSREQRDLLDNYEIDAQTSIAGAGWGDQLPAFIPAPRELLEAIGRQIVERAEKAARRARIARISTAIVGGDPADAIIDAARRQKADLIVMGTRGLGDFRGWLLGSVSHKVIARAHCACLTVK